jgi:hypothetical protein
MARLGDKMKKAQKITFKARDKNSYDICLPPVPASEMLPEWWKKMSPYVGDKLLVGNNVNNSSPKKCMPMLDALTNGYIIPLWSDVQVLQSDDGPFITWKIKTKNVFELHGDNAKHMVPPPVGYGATVFKFMNVWIPQLPKGYSYAVVEPLGFRDLPFKAIPAIVDGDKSTLEILTPIWVKEGFEGIVEKGTPMFQIIPFKRDNWESETTYYENGQYDIVEDKNFNGTIINHYIKNVWTRKTFR